MAQRPHSLFNCWNCWNWAQDWCLRSFPVIGLWTLMTSDDENHGKTGNAAMPSKFCQADEFRGKPWSRLPGEFFLIRSEALIFLISFFWSKRRGWVFLSFQHLLQGASRAWDLVEIWVKLDHEQFSSLGNFTSSFVSEKLMRTSVTSVTSVTHLSGCHVCTEEPCRFRAGHGTLWILWWKRRSHTGWLLGRVALCSSILRNQHHGGKCDRFLMALSFFWTWG